MRKTHLSCVLFAVAAPVILSCASDFDPYNEVIGFRVLAVRADRPTLEPGGSTMLDTLVHNADGATIEYSWSWCPLTSGPNDQFACAISHDDLQAQIDMVIGPGTVTVPPYELGNTATATFSYTLPPELFAGLCMALQGQELPAFVARPDCDGEFDITIKLLAKSLGKEILSVKELALAYGETVMLNHNPVIDTVSYWPTDQDELQAVELTAAAPPTLMRDKEYTLRVRIPEEIAEVYTRPPQVEDEMPTMQRENLVLSWFTEAGETNFMRTSYREGEINFADAGTNTLTTPKKVDFAPNRIRLYFVIRDERGGVSWMEREVLLGE